MRAAGAHSYACPFTGGNGGVRRSQEFLDRDRKGFGLFEMRGMARNRRPRAGLLELGEHQALQPLKDARLSLHPMELTYVRALQVYR